MRKTLNRAGIIKTELTEVNNTKIIIGGADLGSLDNKQAVLEQRIEEAKQRAFEEAHLIIKEAESKAKQIIKFALDKQNEIENQGYQKGFDKGFEEGTKEANNQLSETLIEASKILNSIEKERKEALEDEEERVFKIILELARKLFKKDFQYYPDISKEFIRSAISRLEHKSTVNLIINSSIAHKINEIKNLIVAETPGLENITITASEQVNPGDMIVESNKERLDYRLDSILDELILSIQ
ncbi:MAG: flagellar assembly protein [Cyanobacteriota bacterium]|jgi:flagellar assembly protein FliH